MSLEFFVPGVPQTKGSARAFMPKGARHPVITNDNPKNKGWAKTITLEAQRMARQMGMQPTNGPVMLRLTFYVPRPQRVRESGTPSTTRPDLDKMERSVLDALEGVFYLNDAQVCVLHSSKVYGEPVGVHVNFSWA